MLRVSREFGKRFFFRVWLYLCQVIRDRSMNGTFLNAKRMKKDVEYRLSNGDEIALVYDRCSLPLNLNFSFSAPVVEMFQFSELLLGLFLDRHVCHRHLQKRHPPNSLIFFAICAMVMAGDLCIPCIALCQMVEMLAEHNRVSYITKKDRLPPFPFLFSFLF